MVTWSRGGLMMIVIAGKAEEGALDAFILVWGVLGFGAEVGFAALGVVVAVVALVVVAFDAVGAAGAAAGAEEPKEAGGPGEEDGQPQQDVDVVAHDAVDVVFLQRVVEGPDEGGVEDGGGQAKGHDEGAADGADDRRRDAAPAGEEGEKADDDFDAGADDGHDVGNVHPFGHGFVGFEAVAEFFAEQHVGFGLVEAPDLDGIEPELRRAFGARRHVVGFGGLFVVKVNVVVFKTAGAIVPQADVVEVFHVRGRVGGRGEVHAGDG